MCVTLQQWKKIPSHRSADFTFASCWIAERVPRKALQNEQTQRSKPDGCETLHSEYLFMPTTLFPRSVSPQQCQAGLLAFGSSRYCVFPWSASTNDGSHSDSLQYQSSITAAGPRRIPDWVSHRLPFSLAPATHERFCVAREHLNCFLIEGISFNKQGSL
jgi:hypothetical protein